MEFYTACSKKRPIRLSEQTRRFAMESLQGRYGDDAMKTPYVEMSEIPGFSELSHQEQSNAAVLKLAQEAPIRICEYESVSGAATVGHGMRFAVPAYYNGKPILDHISHLTVDFMTPVRLGVDYLEKKLDDRTTGETDPVKLEELNGMKVVIRALRLFHGRYLAALKDVKPENYENLKNVPFRPAANFKEAVQSLWFTFAFLRLLGNWPGIGRIDLILGEYLDRDLKERRITLDEAREFLAGFFIKGCEWIESTPPRGSGDAQHYQNIVLGGIDEEGREVTNEVTYLVLDIVEELPIGDFPITVRVNEHSPERLLTRMAEVIRHGGGVVAVYNEPLILRSLVRSGYSEREARQFANDGCWEVQVPGKTYFRYVFFDALQLLLNDTLRLNTDEPAVYDDFETMYKTFLSHLENKLEEIYQGAIDWHLCGDPSGRYWRRGYASSSVSLFEEGCIENARSYTSCGTKYVSVSPHIGGAPDVGNSLYAIDRLVFREKKVSFAELMKILRNNWEGEEELRRYVSDQYVYYGNDDDEADSYTVRVIDDFAALTEQFRGRSPIFFPAGVSTFGRQIDWLPYRCAVPFGRKKGDILSGNTSPTPDTDFEGATAVIRSYCKIDLLRQPCGAALDVKLHPASVQGENGVEALKGLIRGFVRLGGFFMQLDVADANALLEAQKHPEKFKTLSVRVSGWNARFVTLSDRWQQMIIERSTQKKV